MTGPDLLAKQEDLSAILARHRQSREILPKILLCDGWTAKDAALLKSLVALVEVDTAMLLREVVALRPGK